MNDFKVFFAHISRKIRDVSGGMVIGTEIQVFITWRNEWIVHIYCTRDRSFAFGGSKWHIPRYDIFPQKHTIR
jgi:hypothetical protein